MARYARLDPESLRPIAHRIVAQQETLTLITLHSGAFCISGAMKNQ